jgi:hypothetical protein
MELLRERYLQLEDLSRDTIGLDVFDSLRHFTKRSPALETHSKNVLDALRFMTLPRPFCDHGLMAFNASCAEKVRADDFGIGE